VAAADALGEMKVERAVEPLRKALKNEGSFISILDRDVIHYAYGALGKIKSDRAVEVFIKALKNENSIIRSLAAETLGEIYSKIGRRPHHVIHLY
jgi:HEAT repeat protein